MSWRADRMKQYGIRTIGAVVAEPITLAEAQKHLRLDLFGSPPASDDDDWLADIGIPGARDWCEAYIGGSIAAQILELSTNSFPADTIPLPFGPVMSIVEVAYTDTDGAEQVVEEADYALDPYALPPMLRLTYGATWPAARASANSVRIQYQAGYGFTDDSPAVNTLPAGIRGAILLMLGHLFVNRENTVGGPSVSIQEIPLGTAALLERYRMRLSMA